MLKRKKPWAPSIHENTFGVNGVLFPNAVRIMALKKETELSDFKWSFETFETLPWHIKCCLSWQVPKVFLNYINQTFFRISNFEHKATHSGYEF